MKPATTAGASDFTTITWDQQVLLDAGIELFADPFVDKKELLVQAEEAQEIIQTEATEGASSRVSSGDLDTAKETAKDIIDAIAEVIIGTIGGEGSSTRTPIGTGDIPE